MTHATSGVVHVDSTHFPSNQHAVLHAEFRYFQCSAFWAHPVPSLDDQVRMLQHSCVLVWSSCRLRLNTFESVLESDEQMPIATSLTLCGQQKQPFVTVETDFGFELEQAYCTLPEESSDNKHVFLLTSSPLFPRFRRIWERFASVLLFTGQAGRQSSPLNVLLLRLQIDHSSPGCFGNRCQEK